MASIKQLTEKNDNISAIISFIRRNEKATRMELCKALSLSWACISDLVAHLIEENIRIESAQDAKTGATATKGRTPTLLSLNEKKFFLGVDINDSGIAITTLSINGKEIASKKWAEEPFSCEEDLMRSVCEKIEILMPSSENCCGIGIAMEGVRAADCGWLYPMKQGCTSVRPEILLAERYRLPTAVKHDPECVLYSVARHREDCIVVRVDKWIGVAAMKNEKILELPLELGWIRYGEQKLQNILRSCAKKGDHLEIAEALGRSVGNLTLLLGIDTCFLAGEMTAWLEGLSNVFNTALKQANPNATYDLCNVSDASNGAAKLAMAKYTPGGQTKAQ